MFVAIPPVLLAAALPALPLAYIGPGLGAGALSVVLGILGSILLAVIAVVWYPVKRLIKRNKPSTVTKASNAEEPSN